MSLKEKAKTGKEIFDGLLISGFYDRVNNNYRDNIESKELWVRLEDAQKELEELKQKIQEIYDWLPIQFEGFETFRELRIKFQRLLKEEK
jgi:hypothetical protein